MKYSEFKRLMEKHGTIDLIQYGKVDKLLPNPDYSEEKCADLEEQYPDHFDRYMGEDDGESRLRLMEGF